MTFPHRQDRFLLARPRGGLNDTLCQIELCLQHTERFDRTLILDLSRSKGLLEFDAVFRLTASTANVLIGAPPERIAMLNQLPCRPRQVTARLADYRSHTARLSDGRVANCLEGTKIPLSSDLRTDYSEPVLLHDAWGGGDSSKRFLQRVTLEPGLAREIARIVMSLGPNYAAVHIRHTDFRTDDWRAFLKSIRGRTSGRTVLICSDNAEVIAGARTILSGADVRTASEILYEDGRPLHGRTDTDRSMLIQAHRNALIDLIALAGAKDFYRTVNGQLVTSGFSRLAGALCEDRALLASLLGEVHSSISPIPGRVHHIRLWRTRALVLPRWMRQSFRRLGRIAARIFGLR